MRTALFTLTIAAVCLSAGVPYATAQLRGRVTKAAAAAPDEPIEAPVLGFVWTPAGRRGNLRAILGIPGASVLSDAIAFPRGITNMVFAPGQRYALVERAGEAMGLISFNGARTGPVSALPIQISKADAVSFNPGATAALVFSGSERRVQLIAGLPDAPTLAVDFSGGDIPANVKFLAVADDGATVLAGASDGRVYLLTNGGAPRPVYTAGDLGGVAFVAGAASALIFDRSGGKLSLLENLAGTPAARLVADGVTISGNAAMSGFDSGAAIVAGVNSGHVWRIDLVTAEVREIQTPAPVTMLRPLRAASRFLLSSEPGQPAWILDLSGPADTVYFVPERAAAGAQ